MYVKCLFSFLMSKNSTQKMPWRTASARPLLIYREAPALQGYRFYCTCAEKAGISSRWRAAHTATGLAQAGARPDAIGPLWRVLFFFRRGIIQYPMYEKFNDVLLHASQRFRRRSLIGG